MSTLGFIFILIGIFKQDSRYNKAGLACFLFDIGALVLYVIVTLMYRFFPA